MVPVVGEVLDEIEEGAMVKNLYSFRKGRDNLFFALLHSMHTRLHLIVSLDS
jgi:hypothetical protein